MIRITGPSAAANTTPAPRAAGAPFDADDAEIILRTSDGVDFRVHKSILSVASSVFRDMLSIPQPSSPSDDSHLVPLTESSKTLNTLLLFCYPVPDPEIETLSDMRLVLEAARKYDLSFIFQSAFKQLSARFLDENPLGVYCIACHYGWKSEAVKAARRTLDLGSLAQSNSAHAEELSMITGLQYHSLVLYHTACGLVPKEIARQTYWLPFFREFTPRCKTCGERRSVPGYDYFLPLWLTEALDNISAEFEKVPSIKAINKDDHLATALRTVDKCKTCGGRTADETIWTTINAFIDKINKAVDEVELNFN
ncbi:hypothetical protein CONPUDRAFT_126135 [Coniophora puteana RWD-64-598 SS2]|uniref:BTB domain-containing protein n=1 Tax=Coniophora puteana (strain RWD-64-598) TaxID=741705 RepID=A0A5M3MMA4_CONPW|nr:uncharacterized protein CONPUDRAFT_126135 [Coniophora puteana RWD-64-598 SS2]EIW79711.1 hypothetical protein CONPUDRAFT_126135 [Coniophora puteana RWD-64-598 SS2]